MHRRVAVFAVAALLACALALSASPASAGSKQKPLRIMVTNDDGVAGEGMSEMVEALTKLPNVKVTVIAPLENQSGTDGKTTPGPLTVTDATTVAGYPAQAVAGFPADTVVYALEQGGLKQRPHLVIAGINEGQNLGALADELSGTVGAAKAAAARGIPALAASQGLIPDGEPDYATGVKEVVKWVKQHRKALTKKNAEVVLHNLNAPTCAAGTEVREMAEVPLAGSDVQGAIQPQDCASTLEDLPHDIGAFNNGFITLSELPIPTT